MKNFILHPSFFILALAATALSWLLNQQRLADATLGFGVNSKQAHVLPGMARHTSFQGSDRFCCPIGFNRRATVPRTGAEVALIGVFRTNVVALSQYISHLLNRL
jgi:hypothetical protein